MKIKFSLLKRDVGSTENEGNKPYGHVNVVLSFE
jgi:hypothetical protein